ncbi:MAG: undecaprenyl-diphosphate phosphatase [Chitinivibrionia bacterium]|nr:undecaprenyl-diphosphate phosphatase [Chitinivibrionia bacterium]
MERLFDFLNAVIIGIVQGLTEFLPISSTGHMLIAEQFLRGNYSDAFFVLIQVPTIAAAVLVFRKDIAGFFTNYKDPQTRDYVLKLFVAFFITGVGGFTASRLGITLPESVLPVAIALIVGAIIIFVAENRFKKSVSLSNITWTVVIAVAVGQIIAAIFPGSSRSGMAIMGALLVGLTRPEAVKFSFLVGIPTMFAAGGYKLLGEVKAGTAGNLFLPEYIVAYVVATVAAWLTVVWLLKFVQTRDFIPFAWYRIALGVLLLVLFGVGVIS